MSNEARNFVPTRQDLGVAGALLNAHASISATGLSPILGRPPLWCEVTIRRGRMWVDAYHDAVARNEQRRKSIAPRRSVSVTGAGP